MPTPMAWTAYGCCQQRTASPGHSLVTLQLLGSGLAHTRALVRLRSASRSRPLHVVLMGPHSNPAERSSQSTCAHTTCCKAPDKSIRDRKTDTLTYESITWISEATEAPCQHSRRASPHPNLIAHCLSVLAWHAGGQHNSCPNAYTMLQNTHVQQRYRDTCAIR